MNAVDVLKYGNQTVLSTLKGIPEGELTTGGVCGWWSTRDIVAHLASFENVLVDVLNGFLDGGPTPCLDEQVRSPQGFNEVQVAQRQDRTAAEVLAEYKEAQAQTMRLIEQIPEETRRRPGTLPWYGLVYALDDFIAYQYYGHKREHCAQINVFRDTLKK